MPSYDELKAAFDRDAVVLLDGGIGTQLQAMGVPMDNTSWAAAGLRDFAFTVQRMHERYIAAGVDVITTNTYSSARHNLEPMGLGDLTTELNLRAVMLAQQARRNAAGGRRIWIAGSISGFGIVSEGEPNRALHRFARPRGVITAEQARRNLDEQADILAEAGVDFFLIEGTGENAHRRWMIEACQRTGLPYWVGFRVRRDADSDEVRIGYSSRKPFVQALDEVLAPGIAGISLFHSTIAATTPALAILRDKWKGPIATYPEAERADYTRPWRDANEPDHVSPADFARQTLAWVGGGARLVGGCCGINLDWIKQLAGALPRDRRA
jgi:S-methylmethionine-dependent homocysteine/selenocysteine methylase